jgi:hypothetical protein
VSAEVWLDPTELTESVTLDAKLATSFELQQVGVVVPVFSVSWPTAHSGLARPNTFQLCSLPPKRCQDAKLAMHDPKVGAWCLGPTGPPTSAVGAPRTEVPVGIVLRLAPKTAAEVCYNPPSHSLSELPVPTTSGARSHQESQSKLESVCEALV